MRDQVPSVALVAISLALFSGAASAAASYGERLEGFVYAWPVKTFDFTSQQQTLSMAYIDVVPARANGRTVVLLHGKNFCAGTWEDTIRALSAAGYRVIGPDQIGFCKSTKPAAYQYTFQQLAENTHALLASLGVTNYVLVGHSTGGMLAIRYGLEFPSEVSQLVLVDPVGLEDWSAKGVPPVTVDQLLEQERKTTATTIKQYEQATYYAGEWKPAYDRWVDMLAGLYAGPGRERVMWNSALQYDMILSQPVVYRLEDLSMPTVLMVGAKDTTAIGKDFAPSEIKAKLGNYPELAHQTMKALKHGTLVEFPDLGHAPQIQDPSQFNAALLKALDGVSHPAPS